MMRDYRLVVLAGFAMLVGLGTMLGQAMLDPLPAANASTAWMTGNAPRSMATGARGDDIQPDPARHVPLADADSEGGVAGAAIPVPPPNEPVPWPAVPQDPVATRPEPDRADNDGADLYRTGDPTAPDSVEANGTNSDDDGSDEEPHEPGDDEPDDAVGDGSPESGTDEPAAPPPPSAVLTGIVANASQQPLTDGVAYLVAEANWPFADPGDATGSPPGDEANDEDASDEDAGEEDAEPAPEDADNRSTEAPYDEARQVVGRLGAPLSLIDPKGRFTFENVPLAASFRLVIFSPLLRDRVLTRRWESPTYAGEVFLPVDVPAFNGRVTFRFVHDRSGETLDPTAVVVRPLGAQPDPWRSINDDFQTEFSIRETGTYQLDVLLDAPRTVVQPGEKKPLWHIHRGELELATDVSRQIVIRIDEPGAAISGRVVDRVTGKPLAGREITLVHSWPFEATFNRRPRDYDSVVVVSGPDGRFRIPPVATAGDLRLRIVLSPDRMSKTTFPIPAAQVARFAGNEYTMGDIPVENLFPASPGQETGELTVSADARLPLPHAGEPTEAVSR